MNFPEQHHQQVQPGFFSTKAGKITLSIVVVVLLLSTLGIVTFALFSGDDSSTDAEPRASAELSERAPAGPVDSDADGRVADEPEPTTQPAEQTAAEREMTAERSGPSEVTGECPPATFTAYSGTTRDFMVRICESSVGSHTYVGGNGSLGYIVLPTGAVAGSSRTYFLATNGGTSYTVSAEGLTVSTPGAEPWTQAWQSGTLTQLQ